MVEAGTVDNTVLTTKDDRVGLLLFSAGQAAVLRDRPEPRPRGQVEQRDPLREPRDGAGARRQVRRAGQGPDVASRSKGDTKFPNASIALAQFFTNPRSMVQFAKQVAVYPSSPAAYDDPFFAGARGDRGQRSAARRGTSSRPTRTSSRRSRRRPTSTRSSSRRSSRRCSTSVPAQKALSDAVAAANKLLQ